ncbi:MAG: hypothetical protein AAF403_08590, partial [Pseudomonadota bacterium]
MNCLKPPLIKLAKLLLSALIAIPALNFVSYSQTSKLFVGDIPLGIDIEINRVDGDFLVSMNADQVDFLLLKPLLSKFKYNLDFLSNPKISGSLNIILDQTGIVKNAEGNISIDQAQVNIQTISQASLSKRFQIKIRDLSP